MDQWGITWFFLLLLILWMDLFRINWIFEWINEGSLVESYWWLFLNLFFLSLIQIGGLFGYAKAGSLPSLAAGLLFGSAATFGAYQISNNPRNFQVALLTSGALLTVMGMRFYKGGKFMPAGLIASLSLVQVVRLGMRAFGGGNNATK